MVHAKKLSGLVVFLLGTRSRKGRRRPVSDIPPSMKLQMIVKAPVCNTQKHEMVREGHYMASAHGFFRTSYGKGRFLVQKGTIYCL